MSKKMLETNQVKDKSKALSFALEAIKKAQGEGALMSGTETLNDVEFFTSGCPSLDTVLGGGWAKGRIHEIYGPESSGKTTIVLHAIAEVQKAGGLCAFIDAEHALDIKYAQALGIDVSKLLISQPSSAEDALNIVDTLTSSGAVDLIIIDSVAALIPKAELEGEIGDSMIGIQARLMGQAMRKLAGNASRTGTTLMFINQLRMKIGVMFGNPETTSGGNALKFYATQRLDVRKIGTSKDGEEVVASKTKIKCVKNKVAPPFKECEVEIRYGEGIDTLSDLLTTASNQNVIIKSGAWYSYNDAKIGQGAAQARQFLLENPNIVTEIKSKIKP
jgi:recombination protein RecA